VFGALLIIGACLLAAGLLARLAWRVARIRAEAAEAWAARETGDPALAGLDEAAFRRAYFRAHGPRGALHLAAGVVAAAALTVPALLALDAAWRLFWTLSDKPALYEPGLLIWQFYLFFGLIACWVGVAALAMRRYHANPVRNLPHALARERLRKIDTASSA
jgi:hypothetical protein